MKPEEKAQISNALNMRFARWRNINRHVDRIILSILLFMIAFVGSALVDNWMFLERGIESVKYHSFDELLAINSDTVAWLRIDGTHIDYPVVHGEDNFVYLDKGFDGKYYAGGSIFLDKSNDPSFADKYNIVHGHNMAAGVMFGDLERFLEKGFFARHGTGTLLTPEYDYDLQITAAGIYDAYDMDIYTPGGIIPTQKISEKAVLAKKDAAGDPKQILALSTCTNDLNDDRVMVFFRMLNRRKHE